MSEYIYWSEFLDELKDKLPGHHEYKIFRRPTNKKGYGSRMAALHAKIDKWGADLSVSFHFNAANNPDVDGHEVLYCSKKGRYYAGLMNDVFNDYLSNRDRGIKRKRRKDRGGGFLCRGRSVCILIEPYFASHQIFYTPGKRGYYELQNAFVDFFDSV